MYSGPSLGIPKHYLNIASLEKMNILIVLKVLAYQSTQNRVLFKYANLTVDQVIPTSKSKDELLSCCLRNIWLVVSIHDIKLEIEHIRGTNNRVADSLG